MAAPPPPPMSPSPADASVPTTPAALKKNKNNTSSRRTIKNVMREMNKLPYLDYHAQPHGEIQQLDSDEDQTAVIPIDHIVKPVKEAYGKQPNDMKGIYIDWSRWGVSINPKHRPSPYDFPAFERQAQIVKRYERRHTNSEEDTGGGGKKRRSKHDVPGTSSLSGVPPSLKLNTSEVVQPDSLNSLED